MFDTDYRIFTSRTIPSVFPREDSSNVTTNQDSPYGYVPNFDICKLFLSLFVISTVIHFGQSIFYRRWFLLYTVVLAGAIEILGWVGRTWSSQDVLSNNAFTIQIVCTIIAPTPLLAANFVIFGRVIRRLGTTYSRLSPRLYTKIFFSCDLIALVVQGGGGGIASGEANAGKSVALGSNIMLAGIIFQLVIITCFAILAIKFIRQHAQDKSVRSMGPEETPRGKLEGRLRLLVYALALNTVFLYIRAIYRTAELADGFQGKIITTEWLFDVFDAAMVVLAMVTYNFAHVGLLMESEDEFRYKQVAKNSYGMSSSDVTLTRI